VQAKVAEALRSLTFKGSPLLSPGG
jgi:hypothetical protein